MMSVSGGWFFVVASEAITVSGQTIMLPGIGSYIAIAIAERDLAAIGYAVLVMLVVILLYDQLLFRPLLAWSRKFQAEPSADEDNIRPWFLIVLQRARMFDLVQAGVLADQSRHRRCAHRARAAARRHRSSGGRGPRSSGSSTSLCWGSPARCGLDRRFIRQTVDLGEIGWVFLLGLSLPLRVLVLIALASLIWVPIGVAIGLRPRLGRSGSADVAVSRRLSRPICSSRWRSVLILRFGSTRRSG